MTHLLQLDDSLLDDFFLFNGNKYAISYIVEWKYDGSVVYNITLINIDT